MLAGMYLMTIAWLSLTTSAVTGMLPQFPGADKLAHFLMYGGLGAVLRWVFWDAPPRYRNAALVLGGAFAYGALMEVLQSLCTDGMRAFGWGDIAANGIGAAALWCVAGLALRRMPRRPLPILA